MQLVDSVTEDQKKKSRHGVSGPKECEEQHESTVKELCKENLVAGPVHAHATGKPSSDMPKAWLRHQAATLEARLRPSLTKSTEARQLVRCGVGMSGAKGDNIFSAL